MKIFSVKNNVIGSNQCSGLCRMSALPLSGQAPSQNLKNISVTLPNCRIVTSLKLWLDRKTFEFGVPFSDPLSPKSPLILSTSFWLQIYFFRNSRWIKCRCKLVPIGRWRTLSVWVMRYYVKSWQSRASDRWEHLVIRALGGHLKGTLG